MVEVSQVEFWKQRLKEVRSRLNQAARLSLNEREALKSEHRDIEQLLRTLQP